MQNKICLFSFDAMIDYVPSMVHQLNLLKLADEPKATLENYKRFSEISYISERVSSIENKPEWWRDVPPVLKSMAVFSLAEKIGLTNCILIKKKDKNWKDKMEWCYSKFDKINIHIVGDGRVVNYAKVLYDNDLDYIMKWFGPNKGRLGVYSEQLPSDITDSRLVCWDKKQETFGNIKKALVAVFRQESWKKAINPGYSVKNDAILLGKG